MSYEIFPLNFCHNSTNKISPKHNNNNQIYKLLLTNNSSQILVIYIDRQYKCFKTLNQRQTQIKYEGKIDSQMADQFEYIYFNGKCLLLYLNSDNGKLTLQNLVNNKKEDELWFKQTKNITFSLYQEEYKYRVIKQQMNLGQFLQEEQSIIVLFWKVSSLKKSTNREINYEVRVMRIEEKTRNQCNKSQQVQQKINLLYQLNNSKYLDSSYVAFNQHLIFSKPLRIQSTKYLCFSFCFGHVFSYQIEGYSIELSMYSSVGQIVRKFTISSIYNQLVKEIMPTHIQAISKNNNKSILSQQLFVVIKHESMNLLDAGQDHNNINQHQNQQENAIHHQEQHNHHDNQNQGNNAYTEVENQEDFQWIQQNNKDTDQEQTDTYQKYFNHSYDNLDKRYPQHEQRVDLYKIKVETKQNNDYVMGQQKQHKKNQEQQHNYNRSTRELLNINDLKLYKVVTSLPSYRLPQYLQAYPNTIQSVANHNNFENRHDNFSQLLSSTKNQKPILNSSSTHHQVYYHNVFTQFSSSSLSLSLMQPNINIKSQAINNFNDKGQQVTSLMKITYSKNVMYLKMLDSLFNKINSVNTSINSINHNNNHELNQQQQLLTNHDSNQSQLQLKYNQTINNSLNIASDNHNVNSQEHNKFGNIQNFKILILEMLSSSSTNNTN